MAKEKKGGRSGFFEVKAPLTAAKIQLYGRSAEELVGKVVTLDLTRNLKGKGLELRMRVVQDGEELRGEPETLELFQSHIRKMIRKGTDYVEDSFFVTCKDGTVQIKPFLITRNKVSRAIRNHLRTEGKKHLEAYIKARTSKELFSEITTNKVQKELAMKLKKIYPLALCEIRSFRFIAPVVKSAESA